MTISGSPGARHVLLACDKFKGTLTSSEVAESLAAGFVPQAAGLDDAGTSVVSVYAVPIADGGDGSLDVVLHAGATSITVPADDAHGRPATVPIAYDGTTATIEVALVCGLGGDTPTAAAALRAGTAGVGHCVRAALDLGATRIVLGVGGTATSDGGAGLLRALGVQLLDAGGREVAPGGGSLAAVDRIEMSGLDPRLARVDLIVASDVDNPLVGPEGAAAVYGPQKGATPEAVTTLAVGLEQWARRATAAFVHPDAEVIPGAGAGGGLGFAAILLGGRIVPGAEYFLDIAGLAAALASVDLVVTGEGCLDSQTLRGKAPAVVARAATAAGIPVVAVVGTCRLSPDEWQAAGFLDVLSLMDHDPRCATDPARSRAALTAIGARLRREVIGRPPPRGRSTA